MSTKSDFFLGLPLVPELQSPVYELIIGTPSVEASYVIESTAGQISAGTASFNMPTTISLNSTIEVTSSAEMEGIGVRATEMEGIRVRATGENPISVLVTISYPTFSVTGYAAYLVHPNNEVQTASDYEYFALSTDSIALASHKSNILLIGNLNATTVRITPTQTVSLPQNAQTLSPLVNVTAGTTHQVTLDVLQTLLISSSHDLTGTRIVSNKPLTVLTGHQCAQIPTTEAFCEPLYVQVPPTLNWGQAFLLAPFAGRTSSQFYKLVTSENSTTIAYRCGASESQGIHISTAGSGNILFFPANSYCYLTASNPIFVVQAGTGFLTDFLGDPSVTVIPPVSGHINSTSFTSLSSIFFPNNFITVTVQAEHFEESQIILDGTQLSCSWNAIRDIISDRIVGYGCTTSVTSGPHVVLHSGEHGVLSVVAYGWNSQPSLGYAYLTGIKLEVTELSTAGNKE